MQFNLEIGGKIPVKFLERLEIFGNVLVNPDGIVVEGDTSKMSDPETLNIFLDQLDTEEIDYHVLTFDPDTQTNVIEYCYYSLGYSQRFPWIADQNCPGISLDDLHHCLKTEPLPLLLQRIQLPPPLPRLQFPEKTDAPN